MLTPEEQERRAYISGQVELAAAIGASIDLESERVSEAEHERDESNREVQRLEDDLAAADERIASLEEELERARS